MADVLEINDLDELAAYRTVWKALWSQTPGATFFQSYEWFETYWRYYGETQKMRVLAVFSCGKVIGILPLAVRRVTSPAGSVRKLTYPLHEWAATYGPIGPHQAATLATGLRHVLRTPRDWDVIDLPYVDRDGLDRGRTAQAMRQAELPADEAHYATSAIVELDTHWEQYFSARGSRLRRNVRLAERRLQARGELRFVRYRPQGSATGDADPRWDLYDACVALSERTWQAGATDGTTLCDDEIRDFLREVHEVAARCGTLDLNLLLLDGRPIAFAYNYTCDGRVFGLRTGYDAEFSRDGAGNVLKYYMIRDSFERGDAQVDLGPDYLHGKQCWLTRRSESFRYTHYPSSAPRAQALRLWRRFKQRRAAARSA